MKHERYNISSEDGLQLVIHRWTPQDPSQIKAVLHIVHGSLEHSARYAHFAEFLCDQGFVVYSGDHRGHGETQDLNGRKFYFSDADDGWDIMVRDQYLISQSIRADYPDQPLFMLGHSMGSFIARDYIVDHGDEIKGVILSGAGDTHWILKPALFVLNLLDSLGLKSSETKIFHGVLYGTVNNALKNPRTHADFISRDEAIVDAYLADPYCQGTITYDYARQFVRAILRAGKADRFAAPPQNLPFLVISGEEDPVGGTKADGVINVASEYKQAGATDLTLEIVPEARHELINEFGRQRHMAFIADWMKDRL